MLAHIYIVHIYLCIYLCMIIPVYIPSYMCSYMRILLNQCVCCSLTYLYMHMYIEISMHTSIYGYRHGSDHAGTHIYLIYTIYAYIPLYMCPTLVATTYIRMTSTTRPCYSTSATLVGGGAIPSTDSPFIEPGGAL